MPTRSTPATFFVSGCFDRNGTVAASILTPTVRWTVDVPDSVRTQGGAVPAAAGDTVDAWWPSTLRSDAATAFVRIGRTGASAQNVTLAVAPNGYTCLHKPGRSTATDASGGVGLTLPLANGSSFNAGSWWVLAYQLVGPLPDNTRSSLLCVGRNRTANMASTLLMSNYLYRWNGHGDYYERSRGDWDAAGTLKWTTDAWSMGNVSNLDVTQVVAFYVPRVANDRFYTYGMAPLGEWLGSALHAVNYNTAGSVNIGLHGVETNAQIDATAPDVVSQTMRIFEVRCYTAPHVFSSNALRSTCQAMVTRWT